VEDARNYNIPCKYGTGQRSQRRPGLTKITAYKETAMSANPESTPLPYQRPAGKRITRDRSKTGTLITTASGLVQVRVPVKININGVLTTVKKTYDLGTTANSKQEIERARLAVLASITTSTIQPSLTITLESFVENTYLREIQQEWRDATVRSTEELWRLHIKPHATSGGRLLLRDIRTHHVQSWLDQIATDAPSRPHLKHLRLSKNSLKRIKSVISAVFKRAKQLGHFEGENPTTDARINLRARGPAETHAYSLDEIQAFLNILPEPAGTIFALASFSGLRAGEIQGLRWEDLHDGALYVSRAVHQGKIGEAKTEHSVAPVPLLPTLARKLTIHRLRDGDPATGPIFRTASGKPVSLGNVHKCQVRPALERCTGCGEGPKHKNHTNTPNYEGEHAYAAPALQWHGWHACRRGLGTNLYGLGVPDKVIQMILRHSDDITTRKYYIKTVEKQGIEAMGRLEAALNGQQSDSVEPKEMVN
jgi:integrase